MFLSVRFILHYLCLDTLAFTQMPKEEVVNLEKYGLDLFI